MTGARMCNGGQFAFMMAKTACSMFLAAMPDLDFVDEKFHDANAELPSSSVQSAIKVQCCARVPFKL